VLTNADCAKSTGSQRANDFKDIAIRRLYESHHLRRRLNVNVVLKQDDCLAAMGNCQLLTIESTFKHPNTIEIEKSSRSKTRLSQRPGQFAIVIERGDQVGSALQLQFNQCMLT
jgi:hypothetical protein